MGTLNAKRRTLNLRPTLAGMFWWLNQLHTLLGTIVASAGELADMYFAQYRSLGSGGLSKYVHNWDSGGL